MNTFRNLQYFSSGKTGHKYRIVIFFVCMGNVQHCPIKTLNGSLNRKHKKKGK